MNKSYRKFTASVSNGKLKLYDRSSFNEHISKIEGDIWVCIETAPKSRSPQQNSYYRVILRDVSYQIGYTEDELHEIVKRKFKIQSTKNLSQEQFSLFLDKLIRYFAELGFPTEDPRR